MIASRHHYSAVSILVSAGAGFLLCSSAEQSGAIPCALGAITGSKSPIKVMPPGSSALPTELLKLRGHVEHNELLPDVWQQLYDNGDRLYRSGKYEDAYKQWQLSLKAAE